VRRHHRIVDRADGLRAEDERIPEIAGTCVKNAARLGYVSQCEQRIDPAEHQRQHADEHRPRPGQHQMIEIGEAAFVLPADHRNAPRRPFSLRRQHARISLIVRLRHQCAG